MLIQELLPLAGPAEAIVEVGGPGTLRDLLQAPDHVTKQPYEAEDTSTFADGTVLVAFPGPESTPDLAPALRRLPVGGRVILLLGWPIEDLPYHTLLGPLVDASCQVLQVVPVDKPSRHGAHCAVVAARVDRLAPLRTYLDDTPISVDGDSPDLRALLRLTGEHTFADLIARPARRKLAELRDRDTEQRQRIRQLERDLQAREAKLTVAQERLEASKASMAKLRASATYQLGDTMVQGARRPARAIVSVPVGLVRVWRRRGTNQGPVA
jgi:hypothetical protein